MASIIPTTLRLEGSWKDELVLEAVVEAVPVAVDVVVVEDMIGSKRRIGPQRFGPTAYR